MNKLTQCHCIKNLHNGYYYFIEGGVYKCILRNTWDWYRLCYYYYFDMYDINNKFMGYMYPDAFISHFVADDDINILNGLFNKIMEDE